MTTKLPIFILKDILRLVSNFQLLFINLLITTDPFLLIHHGKE